MRQIQPIIMTGITLLLLFLFAPSAAPAPVAAGTSITVSTAAELAQAINDANSETGDFVGADTISLSADITLDAALPNIDSEIVIEGNGYTIQRNTAGGCFRILYVDLSAELTLKDVTISDGCTTPGSGAARGGNIYNHGTLTLLSTTVQNGLAKSADVSGSPGYAYGGGIYNDGTLTLEQSRITNNTVQAGSGGTSKGGYAFGGGISSDGEIALLTQSEISGNSAIGGNSTNSTGGYAFGGGISSDGDITLLKQSEISGNHVQGGNSATGRGGYAFGGGIEVGGFDSLATLSNVTIANNAVQGGTGASGQGGLVLGGGIYADATLVLNSVTVAGNNATAGPGGPDGVGGLEAYGDTTLSNSILANNSNEDCLYLGSLSSDGYNLVEDDFCFLSGDLTGIDPVLLPLADNGGFTQTFALGNGSPALDAGSCSAGTDQRGEPRPVDLPDYPNADNGCDMGAFEQQPTLATVLAVRTACDRVEVDYLARNPAPAPDTLLEVYRAVPGTSDELVASENFPSTAEGEVYRVSLPLEQRYPDGTAFYVRVDGSTTTPAQPCTP